MSAPESVGRSQSPIVTLACVLASALAYALSDGVVNLWPLAWAAPFPILWLALRVGRRHAFAAAFLAYALGRTGSLPIFLAVIPVRLALGTILGASLGFAATIIAARRVAMRLGLRLYAVAFPIFWTAWEEMVVRPVGAGAEIGFSQATFLPLIQLASLTGVVGVSFVLSFAPALVATVLAQRERGLAWRGLAVGGAAAVVTVVSFGAIRLARAPAAEPVNVGVAVSDQLIERFRTERADEALDVIDAYVRRAHDLASRGAQVVVMPEKFVGVTPAYADRVDERFSAAAAADHVWVVAGLNRIGLPAPRNVAAVYAPDGAKALEYDKIYLVPRWEDGYAPGDRLGLVPTAPGPWAVTVCRDLVVSELGPRLSRAGARLVFSPAWDFVADGPLQLRVARVRAVENGFALVRPAKEGVVTVSDGYGRARLAVPSSSAAEVVALVPVEPGPGETYYARAGDWFGRACVWAAAILLIALLDRTEDNWR